jgi:spermidine synthase
MYQSQSLRAWQTYLLAFTASACSLIIELVAGRIMAPLVGVSLYTWTSIIGVVLRGRGGWVGAAMLLAGVLGIGYWGFSSGVLASDCLAETNYYCIKVQDQEANGEPVKVLVLDHLVHSFNSLAKPEQLTYGYEFVYEALSTLFIGGGGYTFPRYVEARYPGSVIDVIEIDPEVTRTAIERLGLNPAGAIRTINLDARLALAQMPASQRYDLVLGDAFHGFSAPYHLTTKEFNDLVKAHLTPRGIYMLNILDGRTGVFARSAARTMGETFPYTAAIPVVENYADLIRNSWVLIGSQQPLDRSAYLAAADLTPRPDIAAHLWDGPKLAEFIAGGRSVILTDDHAPVDNLLAPVFEESGF